METAEAGEQAQPQSVLKPLITSLPPRGLKQLHGLCRQPREREMYFTHESEGLEEINMYRQLSYDVLIIHDVLKVCSSPV